MTHRPFWKRALVASKIPVALAGLLLAFLAGLTVVGYLRDRAPDDAPMGEHVLPDEPKYTADIIRAALAVSTQSRQRLINNWNKPESERPSSERDNRGFSPYDYTRDAHAKGNGCVLATFTVNRDLDERFSYGVFAKQAGKTDHEHSYNAIIRFSNGNPSVQRDSARDTRGFAIKLFDVAGDKLLPGEEKDSTQDFLLNDSPTFFIRTLPEYASFNHVVATTDPDASWLGRTLEKVSFTRDLAGLLPALRHYFLSPTWQPWAWHSRELLLAIKAAGARPASLVMTRYYSAVAYAMGPRHFVKYSAIPCSGNRPIPSGGVSDSASDYLRLELARQSLRGGACFDFAVQLQKRGANMPVEDATVEWNEKDSPFIPLAHITIKPADNNTEAMNRQCENTAFNPWHSLPDHRPVGVMNRVRMGLYQAISRFRQAKNCSANPCDPQKCNSLNWPDNGAEIGCPGAPAK